MKRIVLRATALSFPFLVLMGTVPHSSGSFAASMYDYCQVPPYVVQNIAPNVMLMVDTSGSMFNFAYFDGFHTTDPSDDINCIDNASRCCTDSSSPCTDFAGPGTYPDYKYYGYFNPDYWYTYSSNRFVPSAPKTGSGILGARAKDSAEWDGNFLNWLTMRRVDVLRKVLTGGAKTTGEGSGYDRLVGEVADCDSRGKYKRISPAENYTPFSGNRKFYVLSAGGSCNGSGSGTSSFNVRNDTGGGDGTGAAGTYNVAVRVPVPVEGLLQSDVGARARLGLTFFNTNDGGFIRVPVAGGSLSSTVNEVNLTRPSTNTPLGETLWTIVGDFAQQSSISGYNSPSGTGPRYASADYQINANNDPFNYGTPGPARYPICSKSFVLLITDGEPCSDGDLPTNLLNYSSGLSAFNCSGGGCPLVDNTTAPALTGPGNFSFPAVTFPSCTAGGYTAGLEDVALFAHTKDLRNSPTMGTDNIAKVQNLTLFTVFAFGKGSTLLKYAAINGGFEDIDLSNTPNAQAEWDKDGNGKPDTYYESTDGYELEQSIRDAFSSILKRASSGTAASVLASGEGSGANLIQAVFYPRRRFGNDIAWWTGSLKNLWYYVDPFFSNATIREETVVDSKLNLVSDYIVQFYFDPAAELTKARRWVDTNGDGVADNNASTRSFEDLSNLWEAGTRLWQRDLTTSSRTIYTNLDGSSTMFPFTVGNASTLSSYMVPDTGDDVPTLIRYIQGIDNTDDLTLRSRTITLGSDNNVWKLGDIVNSTPRIVASVPLNKYDSAYNDLTYKAFIGTTDYANRGMVFTGGNDGMLHAFRLGQLQLSWTGKTDTEKAKLENLDPSSYTLGDEAWAFIPKNALPYLKYLKNPDYCHLYYTDLSPYVFDASIGGATTDPLAIGSWRTVLIGGMRTGGACANTCTTGQDCVKTPAADKGFSSYFALDVTDPAAPSLLWEFSDPDLGFATSGPAVVRIHALNSVTSTRDRTLNGEWYVVFGSGPTGPIDNTNNQFLGRSNQNLRFFVLNLKTGALVQTIDTGITYAFAGSLINSVADFNLDYQDDAIYAGYVKRAGSSGSYTWTDGGVARILTKNITPANGVGSGWAMSRVIDGIGPVTSSVARLQNKNYSTNWLYFGTGRYFYENPPTGTNTTPDIDDPTLRRKLFALREPCFTANNTINPACTDNIVFSTSDASFPNVTDIANVPSESTANSAGFKGWFIDLDISSNMGPPPVLTTYYTYDNVTRPFRTERVITDPLATTSGVVFFTTYKPYADECALGGKSFLWALRYNTGGAPSSGVLKGKALVQVSTASVEQIDLSLAFRMDAGEGAGGLHKDGRRTAAIEGVPPTAQGLSLLSQPPPVKRILHMMER